jgi:rhodanese-related sulfurtransferase
MKLLRSEGRMEDLVCGVPMPCHCPAFVPSSPLCTPSPAASFTSDASSYNSYLSPDPVFSPTSTKWAYGTSGLELPRLAVLDLRPSDKFLVSHIRDSHNIPLQLSQEDLFGDARALEHRWAELRQSLDGDAWVWEVEGKVLVLCADGDSSRLATSILRARGREALCVEGGYPALYEYAATVNGRRVRNAEGWH